jgi:hypothetical protein
LFPGETGTAWRGSSRGKRLVDEERQAGNIVAPGQPIPEAEVWFHDHHRAGGTPFDPLEIQILKYITSGAGAFQLMPWSQHPRA